MKTQVVQLDRHDDVTSVNDKITWSKASRVLLVWPKRGRVLDRPLDLLLVQRLCLDLGTQLACVASDDDILDHAKELGIPVFRSAKVAERLPWRRTRRKKMFEPRVFQTLEAIESKKIEKRSAGKGWMENPWFRGSVFALGFLAFLSLAFILIPKARIILAMKVEEESVQVPVWVSEDLHEVNVSGGVPAVWFSTIVEGQDTIQTSGSMSVPEKAATGRVRFTNLTDRPITIPAGIILQPLNPPLISFTTSRPVELTGKIGVSAETTVEAVQVGSQGNIGPGMIRAVTGPLGASVTVTNTEATSGGRDLSNRTAAETDVVALRQRLTDHLRSIALTDLQAKVPAENRILAGTMKLVKIQEEKLEPSMGLPSDQTTMSLRMEFEILTVRKADLEQISRAVLDSSLPSGKYSLPSSFRLEDVTQPMNINGQMAWAIRAQQLIQTKLDARDLLSAVAGKNKGDASLNISKIIDPASPPEIIISPSWWPLVPILPGRIELEVR